MISESRYKKFCKKRNLIKKEIKRIESVVVKPTKEVNKILEENNTTILNNGIKLSELIKRTELSYDKLEKIDINRKKLPKDVVNEVEIQLKYEGYIKMQESQVAKFKKLEKKALSDKIEYSKIKGLSLEARQKLDKQKPQSVGQASRISGVSPADISVLLIYLEQEKRK